MADNAERLAEIREREAQTTPGGWRWFGNVDSNNIGLATTHSGRQYVMTFRRWGMRNAQPMFRHTEPGGKWPVMTSASELAVFEVCPDAEKRSDPRVYRGDVIGFRSADAEFVAHARSDVPFLLSLLDARDARIAHLEAELEAVKRSRVYEPCVLGPDGRCTRWAHNHEDGV